MWRVGYGDGKETDLPKNRNLEPLMPASQPFTDLNSRIYSSPTIPATPYRGRIRSTNVSAVDHHLGSATDEQQQNKGGSSNNIEEVGMVASSRWNPTPEQLHDLEEMYRSGTRTPSANQIQQIALKLRRFGKIEGKNVFYWFQNHKARERQKRRHQQQLLNSSSLTEPPLRVNIESLQRKLSGLSRTGFEVGQTKNRETPSTCSTISEESVSMPTAVVAKSKTYERIQFEATEFQQKISTGCTTTAQHAMKQTEFSSPPTITKVPNREINTKNPGDEREYLTLELFPLSISDRDHAIPMIELAKNDSGGPVTNKSNKFTPIQFFEFLPLKK